MVYQHAAHAEFQLQPQSKCILQFNRTNFPHRLIHIIHRVYIARFQQSYRGPSQQTWTFPSVICDWHHRTYVTQSVSMRTSDAVELREMIKCRKHRSR